MRLAVGVMITIVLSVSLGLLIALLASGPSQPSPFSECMDYPLNSPPSSCRPLAPVLLLLAALLLSFATYSIVNHRKRRQK
ncbi:MAG: hypothetical protein ABSD99_04295 [Candidatus Bathyarchaeia archaeon]